MSEGDAQALNSVGIAARLLRQFDVVQRFGMKLVRIPNLLLSVLGSTFLVFGLALGNAIERKDLGISIVFLTASIGAALLSLLLPKWVYQRMIATMEQRQRTSESIRD